MVKHPCCFRKVSKKNVKHHGKDLAKSMVKHGDHGQNRANTLQNNVKHNINMVNIVKDNRNMR